MPAPTERPHSGKWFEELEPGLIIHHAIRRTITEADNVWFTTLSMNPAALHLDFHYAQTETEFAQPLVNSMLTMAMVVGISVHETTLGTTVANLGFKETVFPKPMFHGDTLRAETEILDKRESRSKPDRGTVTFRDCAYNQKDELVARCTRVGMMIKRPVA